MASSKKKKQKKADFQKVKLKVGKKIPKGNLVDTTFKAKKIIIKEQLQKSAEQQDGRVKRDIKEYLSKLKHYNMSARGEAMKNLKESLTAFPDLIQANLHALVERLSDVTTDTFTPLRKLNIAVLKLVFGVVQPNQIVPFLPILVAHLRCAMTHIIHEIQADSLSVVDLLIDFFPQHLKYFSKHLLQDFLNQISNRTKTFSAGSSSQPKNSDKLVLASDPSRKVTSLSWYLQVLQRLQNILSTILGSTEADTQLEKELGMRVISWDSEKTLVLPFCCTNYAVASNSMISDKMSDFFEDKEQLKAVVSSLMPLLFQIWIEAKSLVCGDSLEVYQCVAEIVHLLWKLIGKWQKMEKDLTLAGWFVKQFGKVFLTHCMASFPYSGHFNAEKRINLEKVNFSQNTVRLNLLLCDILTCIASVNRNGETQHLNFVRSYMVDTLNCCRKTLSTGNAEVIVDVLKKLFVHDHCQSNQDLLDSTLAALQKFQIGSKCYMHFLHLLREIVEQPRYQHLFVYSSLSSCLAQIPVDLVKADVIPWKLVDIMRLVAPRRQTDFLSNLQLHLPNALERLSGITVSDGNEAEAQRIIIDMLYWLPHIETSLLSLLARLCINQTVGLPLISRALQVLGNRYVQCDPTSWSDGPMAYISFLLSISLGSSKVELLELQRGLPENQRIFSSIFHFDTVREFRIIMDLKERLIIQNDLMMTGLKALHLVCAGVFLQEVLQRFLVRILDEYTILPLRCVESLLAMTCDLLRGSEMLEDLRLSLLQLFILYLEIQATEEKSGSLSLPVISKVMSIPDLSNLICHRLLKLSSSDLSDGNIRILGEMTLMIAKSCQQQHAEIIVKVLQHLKNANEKIVSTSLWFVSAVYEISCKNGSRMQ